MSLTPAVLDTDAFSLLFVRLGATDSRIPVWRSALAGRRLSISFQTRAELLKGAQQGKWGPARLAELDAILERTPTIRADDEVVAAWAVLTAACREAGLGLHAKQHDGDRWVAACAIARSLPLLAGDQIYDGAPGLTLL